MNIKERKEIFFHIKYNDYCASSYNIKQQVYIKTINT